MVGGFLIDKALFLLCKILNFKIKNMKTLKIWSIKLSLIIIIIVVFIPVSVIHIIKAIRYPSFRTRFLGTVDLFSSDKQITYPVVIKDFDQIWNEEIKEMTPEEVKTYCDSEDFKEQVNYNIFPFHFHARLTNTFKEDLTNKWICYGRFKDLKTAKKLNVFKNKEKYRIIDIRTNIIVDCNC